MTKGDKKLMEEIERFDFEVELEKNDDLSTPKLRNNEEGEDEMDDEKLKKELEECSEMASREIEKIANDPKEVEDLEKRLNQAKYDANCSNNEISRGQGHSFFKKKRMRY